MGLLDGIFNRPAPSFGEVSRRFIQGGIPQVLTMKSAAPTFAEALSKGFQSRNQILTNQLRFSEQNSLGPVSFVPFGGGPTRFTGFVKGRPPYQGAAPFRLAPEAIRNLKKLKLQDTIVNTPQYRPMTGMDIANLPVEGAKILFDIIKSLPRGIGREQMRTSAGKYAEGFRRFIKK